VKAFTNRDFRLRTHLAHAAAPSSSAHRATTAPVMRNAGAERELTNDMSP